jgi:hypothetical protein
MSPEQSLHTIQENEAGLDSKNQGFVFESEEDRLLKDASRPDIEKIQLFTKMLRRNAMLAYYLRLQQKTST